MTEAREPHSVGRHRPSRHRLGPHVVGQRVVVRHLLPDGRATDVLGTCTAWGEEVVVVESDRGPVSIPTASIVTGKPVPPRASVRARVSPRDVELHVASLWDDQESVPLGDWVLRTAPPYDGRLRRRANSALAMGDPGLPLAEAAARAVDHYRERDRSPLAQVVVGSQEDRGLAALGWTPLADGAAHCQLSSVARALRACNRQLVALDGPSNSRKDTPTAGYREVGHRVEVELDDGLACGMAALDGDWLGLHALHVDPAHRRTGRGTAVLAELLDWGASRGATTAWLHVEVDNPGAIALYERLGFVTHHTYRYLTAPAIDLPEPAPLSHHRHDDRGA